MVDTPGMYALLPITEEEAVARRLLLEEHPAQVLHVVDAKNVQRMLPMTLQLLEAGLPVTLALNMLDESEELGFDFDLPLLSELLGIPVHGTAGAVNRGVPALIASLNQQLCYLPPAPAHDSAPAPHALPAGIHTGPYLITYHAAIERALATISTLIG